jgi:hypothetical protein
MLWKVNGVVQFGQSTLHNQNTYLHILNAP